jgi:hypothetical protein
MVRLKENSLGNACACSAASFLDSLNQLRFTLLQLSEANSAVYAFEMQKRFISQIIVIV